MPWLTRIVKIDGDDFEGMALVLLQKKPRRGAKLHGQFEGYRVASNRNNRADAIFVATRGKDYSITGE